MKLAFLAAAALLAAAPATAQQISQGPQPAPLPASLPAPQDVAYPGVMKLSVDATDTDRRIFRVRQTIPVAKAGPMTLLYPQWLPGKHAPRGAVDKVAGLIVTADGRRLEWTRDPVESYAYHLDVPQDAATIELEFQFLSPTAPDQGRVVVTPQMLNLQWEQVAFYPAGYFTRRIMVEPTVRLPEGWKFGAALETASTPDAQTTTFKPVSFETLVDSPMFAGLYFRSFDLDPGGRSPVRLNVVADTPEALDAKPEQIEIHRNLVRQADRLFGARHYDHYDFLFALTEKLGGIGLEHHRSSENARTPGYFTEWAKTAPGRDLLAHEYTHSWNGKFRRGADSWTAEYSVPMRNSLLWVYEGQTQYWGHVLAARAGLWTRQEALDAIASTAAVYQARVARDWRPLLDTVNDPMISGRRPQPWLSWQRSEDYYSEGQLIWLDADTLIREKSGGKRSLDDFAKAFFGGRDGDWTVKTYTFADVVAALNAVQPYDWAAFLRQRVDKIAPAPLDGLARGGYRLIFTDTPTDFFKAGETARKTTDLTYSLGFAANKDGELTSVQWEGPAFKAGLTTGMKLIAVNGYAYDADRLKRAVTAAKGAGPAVELIVKFGDQFRTAKIDYHDGLRYPRLERIAGTEARLDAILAPRK